MKSVTFEERQVVTDDAFASKKEKGLKMDTKIVMSEGITPGARQYKWYHLLADNGESLLGFYAEPVMFAWAKLTGAFERIPWQEGSPVSSSGNYRIESQGCVNITYLRKA